MQADRKDLPRSATSMSWKQAFWQFIWPRRKHVGVGLVLILISRLASLVLPGASKYLIDDVIVNKDMQMLYWLLGAVVLAIAVQSVTSFLLTKLLSVEAQHMISQLRTDVQRKILSLPISFFDSTKSGALVSRIMTCLLYTSDAADERSSVDLGGRRIIKKKTALTH
mgnify:CR=1 FL=1